MNFIKHLFTFFKLIKKKHLKGELRKYSRVAQLYDLI